MEEFVKNEEIKSDKQCYEKIFRLLKAYYSNFDFGKNEKHRKRYKDCLDCLPEPGEESAYERWVVAREVISGAFKCAYGYDKAGCEASVYAYNLVNLYEKCGFIKNDYDEVIAILKQKGSKVAGI